MLEPWEAATLAAIIASPSAYDPKFYPENALGRRNLVLEKMAEQGYITEAQLHEGIKQALPAPNDIEPPTLDSKAPYFTAWLRQQLVDRYGAAKAFFGGLKVKSTLDLKLQAAPKKPSTATSATCRRPPRWSSSTTTTPASRRWSAGPTSKPRPSTWRPWVTASPAPRSSRSR